MLKKLIAGEDHGNNIIERSRKIIADLHLLKKQSDEIKNKYKELKNRPSTYEKN